MRSIVRVGRKGKRTAGAGPWQRPAAEAALASLDSRVQLIQALIPLGLEAVNELLQQEFTTLAGARRIPLQLREMFWERFPSAA